MASQIAEHLVEPAFKDCIVVFAVNEGYVVQRIRPTLGPGNQVMLQKVTFAAAGTTELRPLIEDFVASNSELAAGVIDTMAQKEASAIEHLTRGKR